MAVGDSERIGGVKFFRHLFVGDVQESLQHVGDLVLGGVSVASDGHFDFHRRVLVDGNVARERRCDGDTLCVDDLDHGLRVLVHELRFDCEFGGMILVDELLEKEEFFLQSRILAFHLMHIEHAKVDYFGLVGFGIEEGITHEECSGIDTEDAMMLDEFVNHVQARGTRPRWVCA